MYSCFNRSGVLPWPFLWKLNSVRIFSGILPAVVLCCNSQKPLLLLAGVIINGVQTCFSKQNHIKILFCSFQLSYVLSNDCYGITLNSCKLIKEKNTHSLPSGQIKLKYSCVFSGQSPRDGKLRENMSSSLVLWPMLQTSLDDQPHLFWP